MVPDTTFEIGKAITLRDGNDVAFIATGETVVHALLAAEQLAELGLNCRVLSMHTIKPLDSQRDSARRPRMPRDRHRRRAFGPRRTSAKRVPPC